ncbi:MAG TPA: transcriptional regulator GcvA [Gammaproteobacteria bacterium]|nr:transcriptional regulator GcvA [Gammaproteobacteria bacterium]
MRNQRYDVPPLDPLLAFEAAARNLSFTKAATELFLTQSAVSRQIQQLEEHLGVKLFERRARTLLLTENGQLFYRAAQDALQKLHDSARRLRGPATMNTVVVSTTPGFASLWLIPHLAGFTRGHPHVDVRISATNDVIEDLDRAHVDVAVRYVPEGSVTGGRLLFGETVFPVCSPELAKKLRTPHDLRQHVLLYLEHPRAAWLDWELWFHALGLGDFEPAGKLHFSHYDQLIQAAMDGHGIALGRHPLLRRLLREGKLVAPFKNKVASSRAYYVVESAAAKAKAPVREFADWLVDATHAETIDAPAGEAA